MDDDDIAKLKNMAKKKRPAEIAAELGRSRGATSVEVHQLNRRWVNRGCVNEVLATQ